MKTAREETAMEPRPKPRWPRGTCFAWGPSRNRLEGPMLTGTGPFFIASQWGPPRSTAHSHQPDCWPRHTRRPAPRACHTNCTASLSSHLRSKSSIQSWYLALLL